jgi:small subunit ribosomal protein S4
VTKVIKSKYKASRRLGVALWGTGKDAFNNRNYPFEKEN